MQKVITVQQARRITGGRAPLVPVEYEAAVTALEACVALDEAKYWNNAADALAAWAKIHHSDEIVRKAKMLKLHAYRRMGQLAEELRPAGRKLSGEGATKGSLPGPRSLLEEHGLTTAMAGAARVLARLPQRQFDAVLRNPVSPVTVKQQLQDNTLWRQVARQAQSFRSVTRRYTPPEVMATMTDDEVESAQRLFTEIVEWIDDVQQRIAKRSK